MIEQILINTIYKAKVVHSIPGRLRIHIPYLKQIPKEWRLEEGCIQVARRIKGIHQLSLCYQTSNALVHYDQKVLDETGVVQLFQDMAKVAVCHRDDLMHFGVHQKEEALAQFIKLLESQFDLIEFDDA